MPPRYLAVVYAAALISAVVLAPRCSLAQDNVVASIPDTPAGKQFAAWLQVVNSGDLKSIRQFVADNFAPPPGVELPVDAIASRQFGIYQSTDGLTLLKTTSPSPATVTAHLQSKRTGYCIEYTLAVAAEAPHKILGSRLLGCETPAELLPADKLTAEEIERRLDQLLDGLVARDAFSGVVLVAKGDRPIYAKAFGKANLAWNAPNSIDTRFNLASITKMFTAVAVAQLAEQGKLNYEDVVGKFLPEYANKDVAENVTVRHLLTHSSGLRDNPAALDAAMRSVRAQTIRELLTPFEGEPLHLRPGERFQYCNLGYLLLGAIIEKASGEDYYAYIQSHVFEPAGMHATGFYELDADPANLATGYMDAGGGKRRSNIFHLPVRGVPFSCAYSTAPDLATFAGALQNATLLQSQSLDEMWTGKVNHTEPGSQYGYGCIVKRYNGTRIVGHGGGWVGITDKYEIYPDLGYSVVILTNIDSDPNSIAYKLREWLTQGN